MEELRFNYNSGGREKYFEKERVGDCVCRAIAIANNMDYKEVYDRINEYAKKEHIGKRKKKISNARNGVYRSTYEKLLKELGWEFVPLMTIGSGCQAHLRANEIPMNETIICSLSRHLTCVINGVINDTYNCSREGNRCVYGYYIKKDKTAVNEPLKHEIEGVKELEELKEMVKNQIAINQDMLVLIDKQIKRLKDSDN